MDLQPTGFASGIKDVRAPTHSDCLPACSCQRKLHAASNSREIEGDYVKNFGHLLEQKRKEARLSISELASLSGLSELRLRAIEEAGAPSDFDTCHRLNQAISQHKLLIQAEETRGLVAAQMDEDWLGVKLLACLRQSPHLHTTALADWIGAPIDAVAAILARLTRVGVVGVRDRQFVCTEKGSDLLRNLETVTGISLACFNRP
jgi:transcriptional regulator with XRE-family HTH domain